MKHRTFLLFFLPTGLAMFFFIAFPIVSVVIQSLHTPHEAVFVNVENCGPFGCKTEVTIDQKATEKLREKAPVGRFVGLDIFLDRGHLAVEEVADLWKKRESIPGFIKNIQNLPFYRAMGFTVVFTAVVTPLAIFLGLIIALAVNSLSPQLKGLAIFLSLLPFTVTPLLSSLVLFWMVDSRGIVGNTVQWLISDPDFSLKASTGFTWLMLIIWGIWHGIPFAFVVLYAGLQTLPRDQIESAMIDGATRFRQVVHVIIPHLVPLITFVSLMQLMDNFRVFEPIVGFNAEAHATSLTWIIFNDLGGETRQLSAASATSVLTVIFVVILLCPILVKTWRDFKNKG